MTVNHQTITDLHRLIAEAHKGINGFYRYNWQEIANNARSIRPDVDAPVLLLESYSSQLSHNPQKTTNWNDCDISFMLLDFTGGPDEYDKQEEVLARLEGVCLQIVSYLEKCRNERGHWLYGLFDTGTVRLEKVGPIFDNMYGWNVLYNLKRHQDMTFDPSNWNFPPTV